MSDFLEEKVFPDKTVKYSHPDGWGYEVKIVDDYMIQMRYFDLVSDKIEFTEPSFEISTLIFRDLFENIIKDFFPPKMEAK